MNDNTKENIIRYLTGNNKNENYSQDLIYSNTENINTNLYKFIRDKLERFEIHGYVLGRSINGNTLNYSIVYGTYAKSGYTHNRGFIVIIDEVGNPIQFINKFSSNAEIGVIYSVNVDENGNFYMIENNVANDKPRFVMMNNIVVKRREEENYSVIIRKTYTVPETSLLYSGDKLDMQMVKAVGQSRYALFYKKPDTYNSKNYQKPCVTELAVNVGAENEWNDYEGSICNQNGVYYSSYLICSYATWEDDEINFKSLYYLRTVGDNLQIEKKIAKYYNDDNNNITFSIINTFQNVINGNEVYGQYITGTILNSQDAYVTMTRRDTNQLIEQHCIQKVNLMNNTAGWYKIEEGIDKAYTQYKISTVDEEVFFINITYLEDTEGINKYHIKVGRIREDNLYYGDNIYSDILLYTTSAINIQGDTIFLLYVNKQFNLYNINLLWNNYTYNTKQIYNRNNYNGASVNNYKSLLPNSAVLYNSNDKPIFARNLYNKVVNNGTTMSTVEVPYNYINDIAIAKQDLLSYNNNVMIDNEEDIITNQYEELNINFINTILMSNENIPTRPILNRSGATRLNGSMSDTLDYEDILIDKVRLVYEDNTTYIKAINKATRISNYVYQFTFNVYVPNNNGIKEIQLLSDDENTIYQTIDFSNYEKGKTYKISQNVEIQ